jgi:hypothetical protein
MLWAWFITVFCLSLLIHTHWVLIRILFINLLVLDPLFGQSYTVIWDGRETAISVVSSILLPTTSKCIGCGNFSRKFSPCIYIYVPFILFYFITNILNHLNLSSLNRDLNEPMNTAISHTTYLPNKKKNIHDTLSLFFTQL